MDECILASQHPYVEDSELIKRGEITFLIANKPGFFRCGVSQVNGILGMIKRVQLIVHLLNARSKKCENSIMSCISRLQTY